MVGERRGLSAIAGIDVNVICGEIAGPDARATVAGMERDDNGNVLCEHFAMRGAFVEGIFLAAAVTAAEVVAVVVEDAAEAVTVGAAEAAAIANSRR